MHSSPLGPAVASEAVRLARRAIDGILGPDPPPDPAAPFERVRLPPAFEEHRGVFATLKQHPSGLLRGCIGYPTPLYPLRQGIPLAAVAAAIEDPRFAPLRTSELGRITVEVSVLTAPEALDAIRRRDLPRSVRVGTDGLIVRGRGTDGLLLPQVAVEQEWSAEQLLRETCGKAGLALDAWLWPETQVYRFQSVIFSELDPGGAVATSGTPSPVGPTPGNRAVGR